LPRNISSSTGKGVDEISAGREEVTNGNPIAMARNIQRVK
jgi:hypothetical protein